jgi:glyoxylase-like metal-dependent hydrolase (beta-lactamase superfamily II)
MKKILFISLMVLTISLNARSQKVTTYEIFALKFASTEQAIPISTLAINGPEKDSINLIFMFWLIRGNNGKNILVDAGFLKDVEEARGFHIIHFSRPDSILLQTGLKAEDITDIILTHPHWDHMDGISLFPNAHIWIQKEDFNYFVGEAWQKNGINRGFNKRDVISLIELNVSGKITLVNGDDQEIVPGIRVYTGSRHTFNSQYVLVKTDTAKVIIASDNIWIYYNLEKLKSAPSYGTFDPKAYVLAMQRMKRLASNVKLIIPGHDPKVFSKFPKITESVVKIR